MSRDLDQRFRIAPKQRLSRIERRFAGLPWGGEPPSAVAQLALTPHTPRQRPV